MKLRHVKFSVFSDSVSRFKLYLGDGFLDLTIRPHRWRWHWWPFRSWEPSTWAFLTNDEICTCSYHESYHRGHDCVKDNSYPPMACACAGGQPWFCCMNRYARQEQFLLQRVANVLRARVEQG